MEPFAVTTISKLQRISKVLLVISAKILASRNVSKMEDMKECEISLNLGTVKLWKITGENSDLVCLFEWTEKQTGSNCWALLQIGWDKHTNYQGKWSYLSRNEVHLAEGTKTSGREVITWNSRYVILDRHDQKHAQIGSKNWDIKL